MANMGYLGVGSWFLTYLVTFENVFYLYSVYSDRWDIKGTYNYPKNTHNYPGYGYISKFYPSLDTPGYPLSIEVCLDPRLGFPVFRPFCNIVNSCFTKYTFTKSGINCISIFAINSFHACIISTYLTSAFYICTLQPLCAYFECLPNKVHHSKAGSRGPRLVKGSSRILSDNKGCMGNNTFYSFYSYFCISMS